MHALFLRFVVKLDCAEEVAMIGHGHRRHFLMDHQVHQLPDFAGPV